MTKNYMVSIFEKKKPLFQGVNFFFSVGKHKSREIIYHLAFLVAVIIESMKTPVPNSIFSTCSPSILFYIKWFIHEPDGDLTLDSPSLFFREACSCESFLFHPETKVSTILAETSGLKLHKAGNVPRS